MPFLFFDSFAIDDTPLLTFSKQFNLLCCVCLYESVKSEGLKRFNHRRGFTRLDLHLLKFCLRVFYDPFTSLKAIPFLIFYYR